MGTIVNNLGEGRGLPNALPDSLVFIGPKASGLQGRTQFPLENDHELGHLVLGQH